MKNINKIFMAVIAMALLFASCEKEELSNQAEVPQPKTINSEEIAANVAQLLQEEAILNEMVAHFGENKHGGSLESILEMTAPQNEGVKAKKELTKIVEVSKALNAKAEKTGVVEIPELWFYTPEKAFKSTEILVACVPEGDEESWEKVTAYDLDGNVVYLDPKTEPSVPVIVVELDGMESLKLQVELMNKELQAAGLQKKGALLSASFKAAEGGLETTKIEKISLNDVQEPWVKGDAEVYAITSGLRGNVSSQTSEKEAQIAIIALPYLDKSDNDYFPNQVILFWDDYDYKAANIHLYEKDSGYNYKELTAIIIDGVFQIVGTLTVEPWVSALGQVASAVVRAMPDEWYTDDDDYLDSFYTLEKDRAYTNYYGAARNARVTLKPYFIPEN